MLNSLSGGTFHAVSYIFSNSTLRFNVGDVSASKFLNQTNLSRCNFWIFFTLVCRNPNLKSLPNHLTSQFSSFQWQNSHISCLRGFGATRPITSICHVTFFNFYHFHVDIFRLWASSSSHILSPKKQRYGLEKGQLPSHPTDTHTPMPSLLSASEGPQCLLTHWGTCRCTQWCTSSLGSHKAFFCHQRSL